MSDAATFKDEGNAKFGAGEYAAAIAAYTKAVELDPQNHVYYSNRSAAYLKSGNSADKALADAEKCVELAPNFAKGYSRQAAALQELKRWPEAIAICDEGARVVGPSESENLSSMKHQVKAREIRDKMRGAWHGTVSQTLGGYNQEMEFLDDSGVRVEVLGRSIVGRYWMDCSVEPLHLNIQVPMQDVPPGMPPPPPVPYIVKVDGDGLHICCPVMAMDRPTEFKGDGYCVMKKGRLAVAQDAEVSKLTKDQKLVRCCKELIDALPKDRLEQLNQADSEEVAREKVMAQVRFESSMYLVQNKFGEDIVKEVLSATRTPADVPKILRGSPDLEVLGEKLKLCGVLDEEGAADAMGGAAAGQSAAQTQNSSSAAESSKPKNISAGDVEAVKGTTMPVPCIILTVVACAAAGAALFVSKQRR